MGIVPPLSVLSCLQGRILPLTPCHGSGYLNSLWALPSARYCATFILSRGLGLISATYIIWSPSHSIQLDLLVVCEMTGSPHYYLVFPYGLTSSARRAVLGRTPPHFWDWLLRLWFER